MSADGATVLVGNPGRTVGFVLSRKLSLTPGEWSEVRDIVAARGYNSCTFITSPATGGRAGHPLCALWVHRCRRGHTSDRRGDTDG